jgi:hypothetical protein
VDDQDIAIGFAAAGDAFWSSSVHNSAAFNADYSVQLTLPRYLALPLTPRVAGTGVLDCVLDSALDIESPDLDIKA